MISMERAVQTAFENYQSLYPTDAAKDPLLEGIEKTEDGRFWDVTIGFNTIETVLPTALEEAMAHWKNPVFGSRTLDRRRLTRRYKTFRIDAETGEFAAVRRNDS